jgi:hypothetical protein
MVSMHPKWLPVQIPSPYRRMSQFTFEEKMKKLDLKKQMPALYKPSKKEITVVDVPDMNFLMIDGKGDPNTSEEYAQAVAALYALAYSVKFHIKKGKKAVDFAVMPLEGLWWMDDMRLFSDKNKGAWKWTMMIAQPDFITSDLVHDQLAEVAKKKDLPALPRIRFGVYHEGRAAQILFIGPYSGEGPTIARIHEHIRQAGGDRRGKHHEIYLNDPRRTAPEKLQSILRQPFA